MVNVYNNYECEEVIGTVKYNQNLDQWDGRNWSNGGVGRHKGITKTKDGRFVLIYGSDWEGDNDFAVVISEDRAVQEIAQSNKHELLKEFGLELPKLD